MGRPDDPRHPAGAAGRRPARGAARRCRVLGRRGGRKVPRRLLGRRQPGEPRITVPVGEDGDQHHDRTGTTRAATGGGGFGGFGGGGFASSAAATGTISVVDGNTLYVLTATGSLVKVTLTPSTTITRNADATAVDLRPGDTVVVQGTTSPNGNVSATSVAATAPGVSSTAGRSASAAEPALRRRRRDLDHDDGG